jgi:F-type H+-transporting ATPase subunit gamma
VPNLKDIRRRIKSVKNTQKITQAMRMVAAAKVKRAEARMKAGRPFAQALNEMMNQVWPKLLAATKDQEGSDLTTSRYLPLLTGRSLRRVGLVVITSDRGLCGAFNGNVLKEATLKIKAYEAQGIIPRVYLVGSKAIQFFKKRYPNMAVLGRMQGITAAPSIQHAKQLMDTLTHALEDDQIDRVDVLFTRFKSMVSYQVTCQTLFPLSEEAPPETLTVSTRTTKETALPPQWLFEPTPESIVDSFLPLYLQQSLFAQLLESTASELAARMTAMASATDNAKDMINRLTLVYNKARQASITQEIMEIVGGAEALAK